MSPVAAELASADRAPPPPPELLEVDVVADAPLAALVPAVELDLELEEPQAAAMRASASAAAAAIDLGDFMGRTVPS
jgi:hypothetical protein